MRSRLLLWWASVSPAAGADLETADGEICGFLVADRRGSDGTQLFVSYRVPAAGRCTPCGAAAAGSRQAHGAHRPVLQLVRTGAGSDLDRLLHSVEAKDFLRQGYDPVSPDGSEHFRLCQGDDDDRLRTGDRPGQARRCLRSALVLQGDRDEVTLKHGAAVAAALGDGRLAVLPGTHGPPTGLPEVVSPLLVSFPARSTLLL